MKIAKVAVAVVAVCAMTTMVAQAGVYKASVNLRSWEQGEDGIEKGKITDKDLKEVVASELEVDVKDLICVYDGDETGGNLLVVDEATLGDDVFVVIGSLIPSSGPEEDNSSSSKDIFDFVKFADFESGDEIIVDVFPNGTGVLDGSITFPESGPSTLKIDGRLFGEILNGLSEPTDAVFEGKIKVSGKDLLDELL